jgi:putative ABC transport system permease protein
LQFLAEAMVLSSLGGIMGVFLGLAAAMAGPSAIGVPAPLVLNHKIVLVAFLFSGAVGVVFG